VRCRIRILAIPLLFLPVACSESDGGGGATTGVGGTGSGTTSLSMGGTTSGTMGTSTSVSNTSNVTTGAVATTTGDTTTDGTTTGSGASGTGGATSTGGLEGSGGAGGSGVGGSGVGGSGGGTPNPSPGCGQGGRPDGGRVYDAGVSWIIFPEKYDGNTPLPVLWGWHGCGSYNFGDASRTEYLDETRNSGFEDDYVVVAPLAASGDCFDYNTDIVRTKAIYDELVANYCVDVDRMFGTGHSSGANFLHRMLTGDHVADWEYLGLRGIAPVASGPVNNHTSQVPVMYIHSPGESVDPQGPANNFIDANGCGTSSMPYEVDSCNSAEDGDAVTSNCELYDGCDTTTIFCPHDDSNYSGTVHGIPCFFRQGAYDFFASL
jgi:hypothetical protein